MYSLLFHSSLKTSSLVCLYVGTADFIAEWWIIEPDYNNSSLTHPAAFSECLWSLTLLLKKLQTSKIINPTIFYLFCCTQPKAKASEILALLTVFLYTKTLAILSPTVSVRAGFNRYLSGYGWEKHGLAREWDPQHFCSREFLNIIDFSGGFRFFFFKEGFYGSLWILWSWTEAPGFADVGKWINTPNKNLKHSSRISWNISSVTCLTHICLYLLMHTEKVMMNICSVAYLCTFTMFLLKLAKNYQEYHIRCSHLQS